MFGQITDVSGISVGHWSDFDGATGCTVILASDGAVGGVEVRGDSPGTRETDILNSQNRIEAVHGVILSGGSAFGLNAADGVMKYLEKQGVGVSVGELKVPIVAGAVLYDLYVGDPSVRPGSNEGYHACIDARRDGFEEGSVGAGTGATVGKTRGFENSVKGGIGSASVSLSDGYTVGSIVAVNAIGSIHDPDSGVLIAGPTNKELTMLSAMDDLLNGSCSDDFGFGYNTTIGVVATNAPLTKVQVNRLAMTAHNGLALSIRPSHLSGDGDTMFAISTGGSYGSTRIQGMNSLIAAVVRTTSQAIVNAVKNARGLAGIPAAKEL